MSEVVSPVEALETEALETNVQRDLEAEESSARRALEEEGEGSSRTGRRGFLGRRWVLRPLCWGLAALAVMVFVLQLLIDTPWARKQARILIADYLTGYFEQKVEIAVIYFELLPLSVEVWGLDVAGPKGHEEAGMIHIPWASVDGDLAAFEQRRVRLRQIRVERPVIDLTYFLDGTSNVISFRRTGRKRRFEVYIDRLEVDRAEFRVHQERAEISVDADAVQARMQGLGEMHMGGQVVARNAVLRLPNAEPIQVDLSVKGGFQRGSVLVEEALISGPRLDLDVRGDCEWSRVDRQDRKCLFEIEGESQGELLADLGYFKDLQGELDLAGNLLWRPATTGWRGTVRSREAMAWGRRLEEVEGTLAADRFGVRFSLERALYDGGVLSGEVTWDSDEPGKPYTVDLDFRGIPLDRLLLDQQIPVLGFASRVDGTLLYEFLQGSSRRGQGRSEIRVVADDELGGLPLEGAFPLRIEEGRVRAQALTLQSAEQTTLATGWYDLNGQRGQFDFEIASANLRGLTPLLPLDTSEGPPLWLPTAGEGKVDGTLYLEPGETWGDVELQWEKVETPSLRARQVQGRMRLDRQAIDPLYLELGDGEQSMVMRGRIPFGSDPRGSELAFDAYDWPLAGVRPWLSFDLPLEGRISGHMDLHLNEGVNEGRLAAAVSPADFLLKTASGPRQVPLDRVAGVLQWDEEGVRFEDILGSADCGTMEISGNYRWDGSLDLEIPEAELEMGEEPLLGFMPRKDLEGPVRIQGTIQGSAELPRVDLALAASTIALGGRRLEGRDSRLNVRWQERRFQAKGRLLDMLDLAGGGLLDSDVVDLRFGVSGRDLEGLSELLFEDPPDLGGRFEGQLELRGPSGAMPGATLAVSDFDLRLRGHELEDGGPTRLVFDPEKVTLKSLALREPSTESFFLLDGTVGYGGQGPLDLDLESTMDNAWLEFFDLGFDLEGKMDLDGRISGTYEHPRFTGQGHLREGIMPLGDTFPHRLEKLTGGLEFYPESVVFERLEGELGGGEIMISGSAAFPSVDPEDGELRMPLEEPVPEGGPSPDLDQVRAILAEASPGNGGLASRLEETARGGGPVAEVASSVEAGYSYRMQIDGQDIQMLYPEGWVLRGDIALGMRSTPDGGHLVDGQASFHRMEYLEKIRFDFEQLMRTFLERRRLEVAPTDSLLSSIQLNVGIEAPASLRVRNELADLSGTADLLMRGNLAAPVLYGELALDRGGRLSYNGADYQLERGRILFTDPYKLDPEVDLVATARVRDFDVTMAVAGTFDRLETRFSSEPPLPDLEVFRLLASGGEDAIVDTSSLETRPAERLNEDPSTSAATFLYGQAASVIGERVNTLFGFDKFRIDPLTGSGDNLSKARITVGKRLSKDVFLTFSTAPSSTEARRLQIEWLVRPGLTLVLTQNGDDTYSADARWEETF